MNDDQPTVPTTPVAGVRREVPDSDGDVCITCGDVAVELVVVSVEEDEARCRSDDGRTETIAIDLVMPVHPGDRVLGHAGVAIVKLAAGSTGMSSTARADSPTDPRKVTS